MTVVITGTVLREPARLEHDGRELTGTPIAIVRARAAVRVGVEVGFPGGTGGGEATLDPKAEPARLAATMAYGFDRVDTVEGVAPEQAPPEAIP